MLLLLSGLPGSGKSTLARAYTARRGGTRVSSDLVRADLGLLGHYQPGDKERVYAAMLERTREVLAAGGTAVVDSTFFRDDIRVPFEAVARALGVLEGRPVEEKLLAMFRAFVARSLAVRGRRSWWSA